MKHYITILILITTATLLAQTKDIRAELEIFGGIDEISVTPNESIWLTSTTGQVYFTNNIDSNWHHAKTLIGSDASFSFNNSILNRITFFNNDKAIITGYISTDDNSGEKGGYYITSDGGKIWEIRDYGGDSWIYDVYSMQDGRVWMGGSSGAIFYSQDYGLSWSILNSPYDSSSRMNSIFMKNELEGVSGALDDEIYQTFNNWETYSRIKTPYGQKKYRNDEDTYANNQIKKIILWGDYIVVNQMGHIFYTNKNIMDWKSFSTSIMDFELDEKSNKLFAITDDKKVILLSSPTDFRLVSNQNLDSNPIDLEVVNNSLFVFASGPKVSKVNGQGSTHRIPFTTDTKIPTPIDMRLGKKLMWGVTGNHIYLSEDAGNDWYRENVVDFPISNIRLVNDSLAILWDGHKNNYSYSLKEHTYTLYSYQKPLIELLDDPITEMKITANSQGCFHSEANEVRYILKDESTLKSDSISSTSYKLGGANDFQNEVSIKDLLELLQKINDSPSALPSIVDFDFTDVDKKNYLFLVDERLGGGNAYRAPLKAEDKDFYYNIPNVLDTLQGSIIEDILNDYDGNWSTTTNRFIVQVINQNRDTLIFSRSYSMSSLSWHLPWKVKYNDQHFNCYDVNFSKFIKNNIPKDFMDSKILDNKYMIMSIADYLYSRSSRLR